MTLAKIVSDFEDLYDKIRGDDEDFIDETEFQNKVDELIDVGFMEVHQNLDGENLYSARTGLVWADFVDIDDPITPFNISNADFHGVKNN